MYQLLEANKISFQFRKSLILGFLFCSFVTFSAAGQGERGKSHQDTPAEYESIADHVGQDFSDHEKSSSETGGSKAIIKENKDQLYKHRGEKEVKKEGMSTLSFNLFLYVVDRFKEDN